MRKSTLSLLSLVVAAAIAAPAYAYFTWMGTVSANVVSTGVWGDPVTLEPGMSKAVRTLSATPASFTIASQSEDGALTLDFGEAEPRSRTLWPDVFRVRSLLESPVDLSFEVSGDIAPLIGTVRAAKSNQALLQPGQIVSVVVQLDAGRASPGDYDGDVIVLVDGGRYRFEVPAVLTIR